VQNSRAGLPHRRPSRRRKIADLREKMVDQGATATQIATAIADRYEVTMLTAYRLALGLTQEAVAELYNGRWPSDRPRTGKYVSYWENWKGPGSPPSTGAREPSLVDLGRLAQLYGCRIDDLLGPSGSGANDELAAFIEETTDHGTAVDLPAVPAGWQASDDDPEGRSPTNRRQVLQVGLLGATASWIDWPGPASAAAQTMGRVTPGVVAAIAETVARAQRLDDQQGGGAALGYVSGQFAALSEMLRRTSYDVPTGNTLLTHLAQLAQTAGFMAYDSTQDHQARQWYLTGLRAAGNASDQLLQASILSLMSNQAVTCGKIDEAQQLADAARDAAVDGPPTVRALIGARGSLASAAAGDDLRFQRALDRIATHLDETSTDPAPPWAYYVSETELNAICGRGLVMLTLRTPRLRHTLLPDAEARLHARALSDEPAYGRSELRHAAWLGLAHVHTGHLDQAVQAGERALGRLNGVTSLRSVALLRRLRNDLATHESRSSAVRDLTARMDVQLLG
jgi:transcriptional regulator with XRE-family HTH domain